MRTGSRTRRRWGRVRRIAVRRYDRPCGRGSQEWQPAARLSPTSLALNREVPRGDSGRGIFNLTLFNASNRQNVWYKEFDVVEDEIVENNIRLMGLTSTRRSASTSRLHGAVSGLRATPTSHVQYAVSMRNSHRNILGIDPPEFRQLDHTKRRITPTLTTRASRSVWCLSLLMTLWVLGCNGDNPVGPTAPFNPLDVPIGPSVSRPAFKVMTYNVQLANFGAPNPESRKPMIAEIIRSEAADIVGLQELGSTHRADIEAGLQDLYDFYDGHSARNAELILLRKDVFMAAGEGMVTLNTECGGSLGVTYLEVQSLRGVNFVLFNTHLCFNNPAQHAIQVVDTLAIQYPGRTAILLGDLNSRQGGTTMNFLLEQGQLSGRMSPVQLYDTWVLAGRSRESTRVGTGIDWILTTDGTRQGIDVTDASVVGNATQASDHVPITATLF